MIINLKLNEIVNISISITEKMKDDMIKCDKVLKSGCTSSCKDCSWNNVYFLRESLCTVEDIRDAIVSEE